LGIILALTFYIKSKKDKRPEYSLGSSTLVRESASKIKGLELKYAGEPISNVTFTRLAFWNRGKQTIKGTDIARADPLLIKVGEGCRILDAEVFFQTNKANNVTLNILDDKSTIRINFDYLDYSEGALVGFYHTGILSKDVTFSGTIQGAGVFKQRRVPEVIQQLIILPGKLFRVISFIFLFLLIPIIALIGWLISPKSPTTTEVCLIVLVTVLFWGFGYYLFRPRRVPKLFEILTIEFE
jgi:hypothetical protein